MTGLGNEVPYYIFDYPAEKELLLRESLNRLIRNLKIQNVKILQLNLFEIATDLIQAKIPTQKVIDFERKHGSDKLLEKLRPVLKGSSITKKIASEVEDSDCDVIFLVGVGTVWPLLRSHSVLNNLQSELSNQPVVMFYPGHYTKYDLSLFGKFKDGNYYRAFRLIDYEEETK